MAIWQKRGGGPPCSQAACEARVPCTKPMRWHFALPRSVLCKGHATPPSPREAPCQIDLPNPGQFWSTRILAKGPRSPGPE
eukprot:5547245-Amphidinium_carterae.1